MNKLSFLAVLICAFLCVPCEAGAQTGNVYQAGMARVSLEPETSPFSLALAGYGAPRGGRFSIRWDAARLSPARFKAKLPSALQARLSGKPAPEGTVSVVAFRDRLMALTGKDEIYRLDPGSAEWIRMAVFNGITYNVHLQALAVYKGQLYGLGKDNQVYRAAHQTTGNLSAGALAVTMDKESVVLVGTDLCGFNLDFVNSVKREIGRKHGLKPEAILINASHTHFAPATQDWKTWGNHQLPDTTYLNGTVRPALIRVIAQALKNRKPAYLAFGRGQTQIGHNRTLEGADVPYDNDVDVLQVVNIRDQTKSVVFLTGCHPVFKNEGLQGVTLSANYPGQARQVLTAGGLTDALFIQGCGGDINPVSNDPIQTGTALAADVKAVLNGGLSPLSGNINFHLDSINFAVKRWSRAEIVDFRKANDNSNGDVYAEKNVRWADLMLRLDAAGKMPRYMPVYLHTVNIGNWKLVGISRETVTSYSLAVKNLWPNQLVSVAGYCNDVSSYLPTSRHINAGVYEGNDSFFWYGQPSVFPLNVFETIIDHIKTSNY